ncbi:hypothetical protein Tco_1105015 [Tanacetum coccineum]
MIESPLMDLSFAAPVFSPRDDPIDCFNKATAFLTAVASLRFLLTNNQLRTSLNPRNQATIQDGRVTVQQVQGRQGQSYSGTGYKSNATSFGGNNASGHARTEDLDTYDSDCDDISNAQAVIWPTFPTMAQQNSMILSVIEQMSKQMINHVNNWEKANKEQNNESVTAELERYKKRVKTFDQCLNTDLSSREKMIDSKMDDMIKEKIALKEQVDSFEQNLSKQIKEKECLLQTFTIFKSESKEKEDKYMENKIDLEKKIKELDNVIFKVGQSAKTVHMLTKPQAFYDNIHKQALGYQNPFHLKKAQWIKPTLYDGFVMSDKHVAMPVIDDEETLILEEKSRSKIKPSDALPVKIEAPKKLPKISLVNENLKSLNFTLPNGQCEFFENNNLKAQLQDKSKEENVNYDYCELETKNVELENSVAKLLSENEHLCNEINHVKQELLVYVQDMCLNAIKLSAKKVAVTPKNNVKKVRFVEPLTSSSNIKHVESLNTSDCNTPVLSSTGLKCSTSKCGSKPTGNKRNDRISQIPSHPFTEVGFKWKPTGRTFTIAGNSCPLTRITSANVVPLMQTAFHSVETQKPELKVYNKKPKNVKNIGSSKKAKIVESKTANHSEPNPTWGSNATDIPSSSSLVMTVIPGLFH